MTASESKLDVYFLVKVFAINVEIMFVFILKYALKYYIVLYMVEPTGHVIDKKHNSINLYFCCCSLWYIDYITNEIGSIKMLQYVPLKHLLSLDS